MGLIGFGGLSLCLIWLKLRIYSQFSQPQFGSYLPLALLLILQMTTYSTSKVR